MGRVCARVLGVLWRGAVALGTLAPTGIAAQGPATGTVQGILVDSLRTRRPVAGATIVVLGSPRSARTDGGGRFRLDSLPPGRTVLAFWEPWLDSLGLPAIQREVEVTAGTTRDGSLATPSPLTYQRAACGTPLASGESILVGQVRSTPDGEPAVGAVVRARWIETRLGTRLLNRVIRDVRDTTGADGRYILCGVPAGDPFDLVAFGGAGRTGALEAVLDGRILVARDLRVPAGPDAIGGVRGQVTRVDGTPLPGAVVALLGDTARGVRPGGDGRFAFDRLPAGSHQLVARAIGHRPAVRDVEIGGGDEELGTIRLEPLPQELPTVTVSGRALTEGEYQFEVRRARGVGQFITEAQLAGLRSRTGAALSSLLPRTQTVSDRTGARSILMRGGAQAGWCRPRIFVDDFEYQPIDNQDEESLYQRAKRVELYPASQSPPRYTDFNGCGVLLVWTR